MSFKDIVMPTDKVFFELFESQADVACRAADVLVDIFTDYSDVEEKYRKLKFIEHEGDEITHKAYDELNRTFITPFEPEEISRLITTLDDIVDFMDEGARHLLTYNIEEPAPTMIDIALCLQSATREIQRGVAMLRSLKNVEELQKICIEINRYENIADDLETKALKELFASNDAIHIIKMKDIYEHFENAADKCEDIADVITAIIIRHT